MAKVKLTFSYKTNSSILDLEDLGFDEGTELSDLTEEQKNEIRDSQVEFEFVSCIIEEVED